MKNLLKFGVLALAASLWSCSDDAHKMEVEVPESGIPVRLTLQMPVGSRSTTVDPDDNTNSDAGFEIGKDQENKVNSILVVLASREGTDPNEPYTYKYIASAQADATDNGMQTPGSSTDEIYPSYVVRFRSQALVTYVAENEGENGAPVYVFAYCNPSATFVAQLSGLSEGAAFTDEIMDSNVESIWKPNQFLMTNRTVPEPSKLTSDELATATKEKPIDLGIVEVQRAAVRFDFKQKEADGDLLANQYEIINTGTDGEVGGYVTLDSLALFNMAKSFYYLERVSTSPLWDPSFVCKREYPYISSVTTPQFAWVVSTGLDFKKDYNGGNVSDYFYYATSKPGFKPSDLTYDAFPNGEEDNDDYWNPDIKGYRIWRYATENTIPDTETTDGKPNVENQKHGITTGVLFKGYITGKEGTPLGNLIADGGVLYMYDNKFYSLKGLVAAYNENPNTSVARYFKEMSTLEENEGIINFDEETGEASIAEGASDFKKTVKDGITIYREEDGKYPVYYYYYNRHNDNVAEDPGHIKMGVMEFATVRNNVYKLSVNKITEFGHPGDPDDDPDPEDPGDPDESPKTYFRVEVRVMPWVVRVNNIDL